MPFSTRLLTLILLGFGLLLSFQNCAPVQFEQMPFEALSQIGAACQAGEEVRCQVENGEGVARCADDGQSWGACEPVRCREFFRLENGRCVASACSNGAVNPPACNQCGGGQTMDSQGQCVPQICQAGADRGCVVANGQGRQTCVSNGQGWGSCQVVGCNSGFVPSGNRCIAATCSNGAANPPACDQCGIGQSMVGGACRAQICTPNSTQSCPIPNGQGRQTCSSDGMSWGACQIISCNSGYMQQGTTCVISSCANGANNPPSCTQCPSGQVMSGGQCRTQICTPNSTQSCAISNGQGRQTCSGDGTSWGSCQLVSCNPGFIPSGNSCAPEPMVTVITGTAYCVEYWNGNSWGCGDNRTGNPNNKESWVYIGSAGPGYSSRTPGGCEPGHTQRKQLRNVNGGLIGFTCERDFPQSQAPANRVTGVAYCDPNKIKGWGGQDCGTYGSNFNPATSTWQAYLAANPAGPFNPVCTDGSTPMGILYSVNQQGQTGGISGFACVRGALPIHNHWQPGPTSSGGGGGSTGGGSGGGTTMECRATAFDTNITIGVEALQWTFTPSISNGFGGQRNKVYDVFGQQIANNPVIVNWGRRGPSTYLSNAQVDSFYITPYLMNRQRITVRYEVMQSADGQSWQTCHFANVTFERRSTNSAESCEIPPGFNTNVGGAGQRVFWGGVVLVFTSPDGTLNNKYFECIRQSNGTMDWREFIPLHALQ